MLSGNDGGVGCESESGTWLKMQPQRGTVSDGGHDSKSGGDLGVAISNVSENGGDRSGVEIVSDGDHSGHDDRSRDHSGHDDRRNDLENGNDPMASVHRSESIQLAVRS